jgi:hypothetical protein
MKLEAQRVSSVPWNMTSAAQKVTSVAQMVTSVASRAGSDRKLITILTAWLINQLKFELNYEMLLYNKKKSAIQKDRRISDQ